MRKLRVEILYVYYWLRKYNFKNIKINYENKR